ncbi:MAG: hypothetical protein KF724_08540 [Phycisphaeraceae bacterium]|nr:hypothetical protein [Phycisphaeraceae bacterium]
MKKSLHITLTSQSHHSAPILGAAALAVAAATLAAHGGSRAPTPTAGLPKWEEPSSANGALLLGEVLSRPSKNAWPAATLLRSIGVPVAPRAEVALVADQASLLETFAVVADGVPGRAFVKVLPLAKAALAKGASELHDSESGAHAELTWSAELVAAKIEYGRCHTLALLLQSEYFILSLEPEESMVKLTTLTILGEVVDAAVGMQYIAQVAEAAGPGPDIGGDGIDVVALEASAGPTAKKAKSLDPSITLNLTIHGVPSVAIEDPNDFVPEVSDPGCQNPCAFQQFATTISCQMCFQLLLESMFDAPLGTASRGCTALCIQQPQRSVGGCLGQCAIGFATGVTEYLIFTLENLDACRQQAESSHCECMAIWCGKPC